MYAHCGYSLSVIHRLSVLFWNSLINWSCERRSFVMRNLNPCPENFSQNVVDYPNPLRGWVGVIYYVKSEVLDLELNLLFLGGGVIYYAKSEVLDLELNLLFLGVGGGGVGDNLLHTIGR